MVVGDFKIYYTEYYRPNLRKRGCSNISVKLNMLYEQEYGI